MVNKNAAPDMKKMLHDNNLHPCLFDMTAENMEHSPSVITSPFKVKHLCRHRQPILSYLNWRRPLLEHAQLPSNWEIK